MTMKNLIYTLSIIISTLSVIAIYVLFFDNISESEMISLSVGWVFFFVFGIMGLLLKNKKNRFLLSFLLAILVLALLFVFFVVVFPML